MGLSVERTYQLVGMAVEKGALRDRLKAARICLDPPDLAERSSRIEEHVLDLLDGYETVMVYASKPLEVDTSGLIIRMIQRHGRVVLPIIEPDSRTLRLSYIDDPDVLVPSTFGVPEPIGSERPADPADIDAVVVPMLGFDRAGNRLGYGAGYYDRFLAAHSIGSRIGVALACQELSSVPAEPFDVRMNWIVTEDGPIRCSR
jgi:5-formyltetrahydrofolate cyclo-ligase